MKLGVMLRIGNMDADSIDEKFKQVRDYGFEYCQICMWDPGLFTDGIAAQILAARKKYGINVSTFWCGWWGPRVWNFTEGPQTLGLVPPAYRAVRMQNLIDGSDFAKKLGIDKLATHVGFLPENPSAEEYRSIVAAIRFVADHCKNNGQYFLFETGQETPVTLLRTIQEAGTGNLGVNLDSANLILYGKANPVDALDVFGKYVMDVHAKDGCYPTNGTQLGAEKKIGEGKVDFPAFIKKLREVGYDGTLIIEREISGEQQKRDIIEAKAYLEGLI